MQGKKSLNQMFKYKNYQKQKYHKEELKAEFIWLYITKK